jgi:hypothetical protein
MDELGWTMSEVTHEHLQNLMSQGHMMAAELTTCRMLEDSASPILAGGYVTSYVAFYERGLVFQHTDFLALCYSSMTYNCIT